MQLVSQVRSDVAEAEVVGIVYEPPRYKSLGLRCRDFIRNLKTAGFLINVARRLAGLVSRGLVECSDSLLRFIHATSGQPGGHAEPGLADLDIFCAASGIMLHVTTDFHADDSLGITRALHADLGVVFGTRILKPALFDLPSQGSINIHKRKVPQYRGGGPIGLWELLDREQDLGITVHRVTKEVDAGAIVGQSTIPIESFDTLTSLALKADVIGNDLLVKTIAAIARGDVTETAQTGAGRTFRKPSPSALRAFERQIAAERTPYRPTRGRAGWKLMARAMALAPWVAARNWYRRLSGSFPIVILCHHLVTDRPHALGIPTHWYLKHVEFLKKHYDVLSLREAVESIRTGRSLTRPAVVLTLDDGYGDNYLSLRSIAQSTDVPITLFVCSDKITRHAEFDHDAQWGLSGFRPLTWGQVVDLHKQGFHIASHTRTHFDCGAVEPDRLQAEIQGSQLELERRLGQKVDYFAFPWGKPANMSQPALSIARETYSYVFSAFGGTNVTRGSASEWFFKRILHPNDLWELELALQSILEFDALPKMGVDCA